MFFEKMTKPPQQSNTQSGSTSDHSKGTSVRSDLHNWGTYGGIGFEFAVFIVLGVKGGEWLDDYFGTSYLTLVGLFLGLAAGFRSLFQLARGSTAKS